jgi:hypothetical protein
MGRVFQENICRGRKVTVGSVTFLNVFIIKLKLPVACSERRPLSAGCPGGASSTPCALHSNQHSANASQNQQ